MRTRFFCLLSALCLPVALASAAEPAAPSGASLRAFPGAEGFGAFATGGRGGAVVHVTNLHESGEGSLADAVSKPNRIVVFDVGGIIQLPPNGVLNIASNITIAGQTAPGDGITIYGGRVVAEGSNIIIRYLRMRGSIAMPRGKCTFTCDGATNLILDHCSISWGRWDCVHIKDAKDVTFQYCIIGEGIEPQRFGAITDGTRNWTVHHCLWINNKSRNPKMKCNIEYINNIVYNYGLGIVGGHSAADNYQDVIGNYFIAGPNSGTGKNYLAEWTETDHLYSTGNMIDLNRDGVLNGEPMTSTAGATAMPAPNLHCPAPVTVQTAAQAYASVLASAGASLSRDVTDRRMIEQLRSLGTQGAFINSENDVKGVGELATAPRPQDSDNDGIPDAWETAHGLNPHDASDAVAISKEDGYSNIEKYINSLVPSR